jgi:TonB-linked SusC/RagA family outer membrane protein
MKNVNSSIVRLLKICLLPVALVLVREPAFSMGAGKFNIDKDNPHPNIIIKGKVIGKEGPLAGVTVSVEGSSNSTITDASGSFSLNAPENGTLIFTYSGYKELRIPIKGKSIINVSMVPGANQLDEVVVVGYRTQKRGTVTGAVSSVNASEFSDVPVDNLSNALSGRLSGVTISQGAGTPGMESDIRIRVSGTYNNTSPLFVIDGIVADKFAFDALSPNEVESITILKDGASAAIYGSRAANGVVLVTTRRGKEGSPKLSYNGIMGFQTPTKIPQTLNAYEQASQINLQLKYNKIPETDARYYTPDELDYFKTHSWNWVDEMWKNPLNTQHALDVSGGNQSIRYFLGGSYNYATGSFNNLDYQKYTLRGNMDVSVTKNFKVSLDINTDTRRTNGPSWQTGNWRQEDLYKALLFRSGMVPPYVDGEPVGNWVEWHPGVVVTPSLAGYNKVNWNGLNATVSLNYNVSAVKGLSLKTSLNKYTRDIYTRQMNLPYNMVVFNTLGQHNHLVGDSAIGLRPRAADEFLRTEDDKINRYQYNAQVNYKRSFGQHAIDAVLVYEQAEEDNPTFYGRKDNLISSSIDQYISAQTPTDVGGDESQSARISYVGILSYNYAQKYLLDGSFRYDGSLIFPPENRWGFFPSVSAGWRVSQEPFFRNVHFLNDLKLRASVGMVGNDAVGQFQYLQLYNINNNGAVFNTPTIGIDPGVLPNSNITWEKALTYNTGLDASFLNSRMNFKLDMFYRHTYDILGSSQQSVPNTFGATLASSNYQKIDAEGFEVELGYASKPSKTQLNYYARGNFGFATTKIIRVDEAQNLPSYWSAIGRPVGLNTGGGINKNGYYGNDMLLGYIATSILRTQADIDALPAGYTILGVAPQLGMLNYKDVRGSNSDKPDGKITTDDRVFLGKYSIPPFNYGLTLGASFKSISLDLLLQGIAGAKAMLPTTGRDIQARAEESSLAYWADSWSPDNPNGAYPGYRVSGYRTRFDPSSFFLVDNSFLRLKNISLSYSLPQEVISKSGLKNLRVFFTGTNLLMIYTNNKLYDPEMNTITSYPMMKNYSFGLNIGF